METRLYSVFVKPVSYMLVRQNFNLSPPNSFSFFFIFLLLHNFYHFPSSILISLFLHNFYYFLSSILISLLLLHLFSYSIYFSIHKYIDPTSTSDRPYIDRRLIFFFFNTALWIVKLYITTTTFLFPTDTTTYCFPTRQVIWVWPEFGYFGLRLALLACVWPVTF